MRLPRRIKVLKDIYLDLSDEHLGWYTEMPADQEQYNGTVAAGSVCTLDSNDFIAVSDDLTGQAEFDRADLERLLAEGAIENRDLDVLVEFLRKALGDNKVSVAPSLGMTRILVNMLEADHLKAVLDGYGFHRLYPTHSGMIGLIFEDRTHSL